MKLRRIRSDVCIKGILVGVSSLLAMGFAGMGLASEGPTYVYSAHQVDSGEVDGDSCFSSIERLTEKFTASFASEKILVAQEMAECFTTEGKAYASFIYMVQAYDESGTSELESLVNEYQGSDMHGYTVTLERVQSFPVDARVATLTLSGGRNQVVYEANISNDALPGYISLDKQIERVREIATGNSITDVAKFLKDELSSGDYANLRSSIGKAAGIGFSISYVILLEDGTQLDPQGTWLFWWDCSRKSCDLPQ